MHYKSMLQKIYLNKESKMRVSFAGTKLHKVFVERNKYVEQEYNNYIQVNSKNGKRHRAMEWLFLMRANLAYFILNRHTQKNICENTNQIETFPVIEGTVFKKPHVQAMELLKYEYISFDIFDTLIFRPFCDPKSLFFLVGEKLEILRFYDIRIKAEKKAREISRAQYGTVEVTIFDIYEIISQQTGIDAQYGAMCEIETEIELCMPNPYMKRLYDILKYQGKKIIALSDMYIPAKYMEKILNKCGYDTFEHIIISCDYKANKANGNIYPFVIKRCNCKNEQIVHIGDNENGDIIQAKQSNINTIYYKNVNQAGRRFRPGNMSVLIGNAYKGIVNCYLHNGLYKYSTAYEYGFSVGGFYITGFCSWIHKRVKEKNIQKVLFLARDGDIYIKIFKKMFPNIACEYVYWSRIPSILATVKYGREAFIYSFVYEKTDAHIKTTIGESLNSIEAGFLIKKLNDFGLDADMDIAEHNKELIATFFSNNWSEIVEIYTSKTKELVNYLKGVLGDNSKIAVVDVGWSGNNVLKFRELVQKEVDSNIEITALLAAYEATVRDYCYADGLIEAYIFSNQHNRDLFDMHHASKKPTNNLFEILTQAPSPSFIGMKTGGMEFDTPEVGNYEQIRDIQRGIQDFNCLWTTIFKNYPYMYNISGRDAYLPFAEKIKNINWFKQAFPDFTLSMKILSNRNKQEIETIKDVL